MEWRCEWCGKPHEENDPPCDNCGHGKYEKAIVQQAAGDESDPDSMTVWVCTECGRNHQKNSPPCSRCNNATLERETVTIDESNLTERPGDYTGNNRAALETTTVWVCTECGREHPKHSPPCSRCGNQTLEQEEKAVADAELAVPSYFDLLTPQYAVALVVVLALAGIFAVGALGLADVPGFPSDDVPSVDPPGEATEANGLDLAAVEQAYLNAVNNEREAAGVAPLERTGGLDEIATYRNQMHVIQEFEGGEPPDQDELRELLGQECSTSATSYPGGISYDEDTTAEEAGTALADGILGTEGWEDDQFTITGVDVHAIDGQLFLLQYFCD